MSEHPTTSRNQSDLPAELMGPYSTWKKKDGSGENSNRHTYLLDENGKKQVISRAKFTEQFEVADDTQPAVPDKVPVREAPKGFVWVTRDDGDGGTIESLVPENSDQPAVQYWSGNKIYSSDPNRIPYSPAELPMEEGTRKEKRLRRKIGNKVLRIVASGALIFAPLASSLERESDDRYNNALLESPPTEIIIEATPTSAPDYVIVDEATFSAPLATPEMVTATTASAVLATVEETPSAPVVASTTPDSIATPYSAATSRAESSPAGLVESAATPAIEPTAEAAVGEEDEGIPDEIIEPQSPPPTATPEKVEEPAADSIEVDGSKVEHVDEAEVTPEVESDQDDIEPAAGEIEPLMIRVEVAPGDGITQVLAKIFAEAGYPDLAPEQLFELYEELVTNPEVGPDAIFVGINVEYNEAAGEYWIQGEGGVETHLTEKAAELIQSKIAN